MSDKVLSPVLARLKDLRTWFKRSGGGNLVRHCRYDDPGTGVATYATCTYQDGKEPILTLRQGAIGNKELAKVSEADFKNPEVFIEAWAVKPKGLFDESIAATAPNAKKAPAEGQL